MDAVSLAVAAGLAGSAKAYADAKIAEAIAALPKGVVWRGSVNYYADLPATPDAGDCYTVKYAGTEGTSPSGQEYAWGKYDGVNQWIPIGPDMSVYRTAAAQDVIDSGKADKVASPTAGNFAGLDANGNLTDSGKKASDFLQEHQSLAAYRTSSEQDVIDATKQDTLISAGAAAGQFVRVKTVDATGKPTEYEPVSDNTVHYTTDTGKTDAEKAIARANIGAAAVPNNYELIGEITVTEDVSEIVLNNLMLISCMSRILTTENNLGKTLLFEPTWSQYGTTTNTEHRNNVSIFDGNLLTTLNYWATYEIIGKNGIFNCYSSQATSNTATVSYPRKNYSEFMFNSGYINAVKLRAYNFVFKAGDMIKFYGVRV